MTKSIAVFVGLVLLVVLVLFSMTFTVKYNEVVIRTRFGKTDANSIVPDPGLHFRLPLFADKITVIDKRLQLRETPIDTIQTTDGQQVVVRAFMMWQVDTVNDGPLKFFEHHPEGVEDANQWLLGEFVTAIRSALSRYAFDDLIGTKSKLATAEQAILDEMKKLKSRGIEPKSVGITQLMLPPSTTRAVLTRMQATRAYLSQAERDKGNAQASGIDSRAMAQAEKIRSFANQRAEEIRSAGNKDAAKYIEAMGQDQELAIFLAWLDTLQASLSDQTTFVVPTLFAPFHLLRLDTATDGRGMPQPAAEKGRLSSETPIKKSDATEPADSTPSPTAAAAVAGGS